MYMLVKMGNNWYATKISDVKSYKNDIQAHVNNGNIVALCDDLEYFAHNMDVNQTNIIEV